MKWLTFLIWLKDVVGCSWTNFMSLPLSYLSCYLKYINLNPDYHADGLFIILIVICGLFFFLPNFSLLFVILIISTWTKWRACLSTSADYHLAALCGWIILDIICLWCNMCKRLQAGIWGIWHRAACSPSAFCALVWIKTFVVCSRARCLLCGVYIKMMDPISCRQEEFVFSLDIFR